MEVRRPRRDVTQTRNAENGGIRRGERVKYAVALEKIAADIHPLMAGNASERFEEPVSFKLFGRESRGVPAKPEIELAVRGEQRPLESSDRVQKARPIRRPSIGRNETIRHLWISVELLQNFGDARVQVDRILQRRLDLRLETAKVAFPVQTKAESGVEDP